MRGPERVHIKKLETKNKGVTFNLEKLGDEFIIYQESYDQRIDYIISDKDQEVMLKIVNFMVDAYNDGFTDGKNSALMFNFK